MAEYGGKELANAFRTVRRNTIQIAEEIPEDKYDFVAAPGTRSVSQMLRHIAYVNRLQYDFHRDRRLTTLANYDFAEFIARNRELEGVPRSKAQIIELLRDEGDKYASWMESLSREFLFETYTDMTGQNARTRFENIMAAKEHEMHHRGQLMLIQRMLGLVPHLTRAAEERARARAAAQGAAR